MRVSVTSMMLLFRGKLDRRSDMLSVEDFEDNANLKGAIHTLQTLSEYIMVKIKRDRDPSGR